MCQLAECDRPGRNLAGDGLCEGHYYQQRRGRPFSPLGPYRRPPGCQALGCPDPRASGMAYCWKHYSRLRRHGSVEAVHERGGKFGAGNANWRGEDVGYSGVHQRLRRVRGPASDHDCRCGRVAEQWAYTGPRDAGTRLPYSPDLTLYEPMCVGCHKAYDLAAIKALDRHPGDAVMF